MLNKYTITILTFMFSAPISAMTHGDIELPVPTYKAKLPTPNYRGPAKPVTVAQSQKQISQKQILRHYDDLEKAQSNPPLPKQTAANNSNSDITATHFANAPQNPTIEDFDRFLETASSTHGTDQMLMDYDLNEYVGIESEYAYLPTSRFDHTGNNVANHSLDVLGTISAPLNDQLSLHAKAGLGYLNNPDIEASDANNINIGPAFGIEASYRATSQVFLNLSWMHYSDENNLLNSNQPPRSDILSLGLSYDFNTNRS